MMPSLRPCERALEPAVSCSLHPRERVLRTCVSQLSVSVTKHPREPTKKRKELFWLMASEVLIHVGSKAESMRKTVQLPTAEKQSEMERTE